MMYGQLCTEFYDADKKFAVQEEIALYQTQFNKNDHLLEPMCGSGRFLIPLMQAGYTVHGFDNSKIMLESCKQRAAKKKLTPVLSMNDIDSFPIKKKYDGIIIPLGSFQLLYPQDKAFKSLEKFQRLLVSGGKLIMDLFIPWEVMYEHGDTQQNVRDVKLPSGGYIKIENTTIANKYKQHMLSKTRYTKYIDNKMVSQEDEQMDIVWYYPLEMQLLLEKLGFIDITITMRFLNDCEHMTFIAKKP